MTGRLWDGSSHHFGDNPGHYGAAHFHDDDLVDCKWPADFTWDVPPNLPSAVYGLKLVVEANPGEPGNLSTGPAEGPVDADEFILPLFVTPGATVKRAPVALLISTATYLSYANQRMSLTPSAILRNPKPRNAADAWLLAHPEVGLSQYEYHRDGSGVHFSSHLRPVVNLAPKTLTWGFCADTNLTAWLEAIDQPFDIITDAELDKSGQGALTPYLVVITCSHPEYYSTRMRDGLESWLADDGGRLMYMGGNGFYWRVAFHPEKPAIMEVRRAEGGTRAWMARPGEYNHQFTGEFGGLWRRIGKPPNELAGVGFAAQGFDGGTCYELQAAARDPRLTFMLHGLQEGERFGGYGTQGGGAAGEEIDRFDVNLGSPAHALVVASSVDHKPGMLRTVEEVHMSAPPGADHNVRADVVFFETASGGAVFSTGSISYAGALAHNQYDNDVALMTANTLQRFLDPTPFAAPVAS